MLPLGEILIKKWFLSMHKIYVGTYFYGQIMRQIVRLFKVFPS
jgi:hypothetical protein